ncbi:PDT-domain-containing protein [Obba rivulosa]|uniref:prephenate dehydratase n=1 Tax=Obba rivulosa TaxID=1052685 RepID=A0A8E2J6P8_9APHY|nr:PDT-domain-containing protein [Obba rivulosa]
MADEPQKTAFLGPLGSHSYQCALDTFGNNVHYVEKETITDVLSSVSDEIPFALIPQENSIHGTVIETYDLLRLPEVGQRIFVRGASTLTVRHCLVARRGVKLKDIQRVLSHEQALGQCARFLADTLPGAALVKMPSTSAAAQALLSEDEADQPYASAAICAALCTTVFDGLEVLRTDIQDQNTNVTRFYVLASSLSATPPFSSPSPDRRHALVRIAPATPDGATPQSRPLTLILSTLLTTFGQPAARIDRRPSPRAVPFEDVYFIELQDTAGPPSPGANVDRRAADALWLSRVQAGLERVAGAGGDAALLGVW